MKPGEYILGEGEIELNAGRKTTRVVVSHKGDRPIQVGSHFHFFETNRALSFDRESALGMRLNIKSGTAVRFEPGQTTEVELVEYSGIGYITGFNRLMEGSLHSPALRKQAMENFKAFDTGDKKMPAANE